MKKKISLVVAVLVLVLGLAAPGNAKTVSYDKDTLIQSCDAVFVSLRADPSQATRSQRCQTGIRDI